MEEFFHYTDSEGLQRIIETKRLEKHNGSGLTEHIEGVFFTKKAPNKYTRLEILENNYHEFGWKRHRAKASWFIRVVVDENQVNRFCKRSLQERDVWVYKENLDLNDHSSLVDWSFGQKFRKTPLDSNFDFPADSNIDREDSRTENLNEIKLNPKNEEYPVPSIKPTKPPIHTMFFGPNGKQK